MKIFCLMMSGLPLSDAIRDRLYEAAHSMVRKSLQKLSIRDGNFEGMVTTADKYVSLGSVSGMEFSAIVESGSCKTTVRYIVRTVDLEGIEDAVWMSLSPEPEMSFSRN